MTPSSHSYLKPFTRSYLEQFLRYDPETGLLTWVSAGAHRRREAGWVTEKGYLRVTLHGTHYRATHLIWLLMTGEWPTAQVDHIDNNKTNNRWENLREATNSQNNMNKGVRSDNTSGYKGVYWDSWKHKWRAEIYVNRKKIYLGAYIEIEDAIKAYEEAALKHHGEFRKT